MLDLKDDASKLAEEKKKALLKDRAEKLARLPQVLNPAESISKVLKFTLANGLYAIESCFVKEVYRVKDMTTLPTIPNHILGLINVRRKIIAVLDLQVLFGLSKQELMAGKKVIILEGCDNEFALLIDEINGVALINQAELEFSLLTLTEQQGNYLKGITSDGLAVLDGSMLLSDARIIVNESVE